MSYPIDTTPESPNQSSRNGAPIRLLILHATAGSYASALHELCDPKPTHLKDRVSAHYLVRKDGYINQLVPLAFAAWHAGISSWQGLNSLQIQEQSIGIEIENANDGHDPYPAPQLAALHWLCQTLVARYNIERADVARHRDIAPVRKSDPMPPAFPWPAFADSLYLDAAPPMSTHYHVKASATAGATIRSAPTQQSTRLGVLPPGAAWDGIAVPGQQLYVLGFGSSNQWVKQDTRYVWRGLLQEAL